MRTKTEPNSSDKVEVKIEPISEENHAEMNSKTERSKPKSKSSHNFAK